MIDEDLGKQIVRRLDAIVGLLVHAVTAGKAQTEKINVLSAAGFMPKEIADVIGTTPNTVRVALSVSRKQRAAGTGRRRKHEQQNEGE